MKMRKANCYRTVLPPLYSCNILPVSTKHPQLQIKIKKEDEGQQKCTKCWMMWKSKYNKCVGNNGDYATVRKQTYLEWASLDIFGTMRWLANQLDNYENLTKKMPIVWKLIHRNVSKLLCWNWLSLSVIFQISNSKKNIIKQNE